MSGGELFLIGLGLGLVAGVVFGLCIRASDERDDPGGMK